MIPAGVVWFAMGALFCFLAERARRNKNEFEDRLEALEAEVDARANDS